MNHNKSYRKLGRRADHRKAMLKNLTISLLSAEKIETTVTRAKELRKFAERMITLGKKNIGDFINVETDLIGKYVERLLNFSAPEEKKESKITMEFLLENGF